ncbi:MAG: DUF736 domain-containing protein [Alphaproteobacteria bacterium]|nr:DUF736 domain-containing protein [Alphaproteobacteria bacterium]
MKLTAASSEFLNVQVNKALKAANEQLGSRQSMMRRCGVFELIDGEYVGHVATMNFKCKATIKPNPYRTIGTEPEWIVLQAGAEIFNSDIGFGWDKKTDGTQTPYMQVHLDDPTFTKTLQCVLIKGPRNLYNLFWDRITISEEDVERQIITEEMIPYIGVLRPIDKVTDYLIEIYPSLQEIWDPD